MAPRHQTLPPAQTSSAREALQAFHCTLCSKGYSRVNDYEAHLSSYDHAHKQRLKDMKAMVKDPGAGARARRAEAKADGIVSIKIGGAGGAGEGEGAAAAGNAGGAGGGFKKGGFKKSGFKSAFGAAAATAPSAGAVSAGAEVDAGAAQARSETVDAATGQQGARESDSEDDDYERYNPRFPTD